LNVDNKLLQKIPIWLIEIHGNDLRRKIIEKFRNAGFKEKLVHIRNQKTFIYRFFLTS